MVKFIKFFTISVVILYVLICFLVYLFQEKIIFIAEKLPDDHVFKFDGDFDEYLIPMSDGIKLNALHFKAYESRGVILRYHGNAGTLESWGANANLYTNLGYDVFIYDYRGYGKSGGRIKSEKQLIEDGETIYAFVEKRFPAESIIIEGYSIGSGMAAQIAAKHEVKQVVLAAPYFSLEDLMRFKFSFLPTFLLNYKLKTNEYLPKVKSPITLIHGTADEVIPSTCSERLKALIKPEDQLILVDGATHNNLSATAEYWAIYNN